MPQSPDEIPPGRRLLCPLALCAVWLGMTLLVHPVGEFPLNDDWSYTRTVRTLVDEGELRICGWMSVPLVAQVLWGRLFCLPFGFSFTALRVSTLVLGLTGVLATYGLLREARASRALACLGALTVLVNPLYFQLSNTFMTDVPFYALGILSVLFFVRAVRRRRTLDIVVATVFGSLAVMIRQIALPLVLSFSAAFIAGSPRKLRTWLGGLAPFAVVAVVFFGLQAVLRLTVGLPDLWHLRNEQLLERVLHPDLTVLRGLASRAAVASIYAGLFLLPFLVVLMRSTSSPSGRRGRWPTVIVPGVVCVAAVTAVLLRGRLMPLAGNILYDFGLGPPGLRDVFLLHLPNTVTAPGGLWLVATVAGVVGAVLTGWTLLTRVRRVSYREDDGGIYLLGVASFVLCLLPSCMVVLFDRYVIFLLPCLMLGLVAGGRTSLRPGRAGVCAAAAVLLVFAAFTVTATHDYFSWNRTRWDALRELTETRGISPRRIDGGFEFNGWVLYEADYVRDPAKSWWWVDDDEYVVSFGPMAGYEVSDTFTFTRWLPPGTGRICVLRRTDVRPAGPSPTTSP